MSAFYLPSSTATTATPSPLTSPPSPKSNPLDNRRSNHAYSDSDDDDDNTPLPFPATLPRSDFLTPNFTPETYLSTLHNRHQTLEDLRSDLRQRSSLITTELLDLVNSNYEEFLSLGTKLKGGEEKIEEVRVGVLGFGREVEAVRDVVAARAEEVGVLLDEKKQLRKDILVGRRLLEIEERLEDLEARLMVEPNNSLSANNPSANDEDSDDEDEEDEEGDSATSTTLSRLRKHAQAYLLLTHLTQQVLEHPFVIAQQSRLFRVRNTLLLDLRTAVKQAQATGVSGKQLLDFLVIYRELGETEEGVGALKGV
ncbi:hypothetical protein M436DRAFT_62499 [Aureobasidium namibiae CBS 147.97]|uniref:Conserved oligomeric Golgi complex subunit 2 n=1 Tax=Aureobasidium namibiae CBS 147.97 TaxID=1043004 RepID=A0A074WPM5_9PEZI|nr:uncharacterized protein M436DRAFT_62499 [Aureobasidium namibiae CBS 147.97]KEQ75090.1 hypothetical protein M436DRAFT_62499 [Aureobasidium namibiae CBS 147.97]